jgi:AhpC/TSA family
MVKPNSRALWVVAWMLATLSLPAAAQQLGPADGHDLPPVDLERVGIGDIAPDFTLGAPMTGGTVTLSEYRGKKNVVLVFYRGYW